MIGQKVGLLVHTLLGPDSRQGAWAAFVTPASCSSCSSVTRESWNFQGSFALVSLDCLLYYHDRSCEGCACGVERSKTLSNCESELFFVKLREKLEAHKKVHPNAKVISLAVGDATEPIPQIITSAMKQFAHGLSTREGFSGYGPHQGPESLRTQIVEVLYKGLGVKSSEVFVSDGAKGCIARLLVS
ncbi:hypothetical protein L7F22_006013 [Adiantum nelumboides]|nr:hypothetical protein [Adiantum nelumboides]